MPVGRPQIQWGLGTETPAMRGAGGENLSFVEYALFTFVQNISTPFLSTNHNLCNYPFE